MEGFKVLHLLSLAGFFFLLSLVIAFFLLVVLVGVFYILVLELFNRQFLFRRRLALVLLLKEKLFLGLFELLLALILAQFGLLFF